MGIMRLSEVNKMVSERHGMGTPHNMGINMPKEMMMKKKDMMMKKPKKMIKLSKARMKISQGVPEV